AGKGSSSRCCNVARTTTRVRKQRTELVKLSITFSLARFPLNRFVSQKRVRIYQEKEKRVGTGRAMPWPGLHAAFLFLALFLWCHVTSVESECCTDVA